MVNTLILGVGNLLLTDDGVGIHVIRSLEQFAHLPDGVRVIDGGTLGLNLLGYLENNERLIIVDAMDTGVQPGIITRLSGEQLPAYFSLKLSPHQVAIPDLLLAAQLIGCYPRKVIVLGIQPGSTAVGLDLSPVVAGKVDQLVAAVLNELNM